MVDKEKKSIRVTLTKPYLDAMDGLVRQGVYANRAEIIKDALRQLFRNGIDPFGLLSFPKKEGEKTNR